MNDQPTDEQVNKAAELFKQGYKHDSGMSLAASGIALRKGNDVWVFGLNGEILHNPQSIVICLN